MQLQLARNRASAHTKYMNTKTLVNFSKMFAVGVVSLFSFVMFAPVASAAPVPLNCTISITQPTTGSYHHGIINIKWTTNNATNCSTTNVNFRYNSPSKDASNLTQITSAFADTGTTGVTFDTTSIYSGDPAGVEDASDYSISADLGGPVFPTVGPFTIDNAPPSILSATTNDSNGNGKIDQLIVKFDESMDSSITNTTGITFGSYTFGGNGAWSNSNQTLTIPITENTNACDYTDQTGCDTSDTSNVAYSSGNLTDLAGNALTAYTATPAIDGAMPAMVGAETLDTDNNGYIDTIKVQFSEKLNNLTVSSSKFDIPGYTVASASGTLIGKVTINLTEKSGIGGDTGITPEVSIMSGQYIYDIATVPNALGAVGNGSTVIPSDGAAPVAMKAEYFTDPSTPASVDRFRVYFSEPISTTAQGSFSNIPGEITVTPNGLTGFGSPTSIVDNTDGTDVVYFQGPGTTDLTGANGGGEPTWTYTYNGIDTLKDDANNLWTTVLPSAKTIVDKAAPVVLYAVTLDKNLDGISGTLELKFSEDIKDYNWYAQKWSLSSDGGSFSDKFITFSTNTINAGGTTNTPNDEYVSMNITSPSTVVGTGVMKYMYSGGGVADMKGNLLADIPFIDGVTTDGAKPQITKLTYKDQNGDGKIDAVTIGFSEPVTAASVLSANDLNFTSVGDFTGMAFGTDSTDLITGTVSSVTIPLGTDATVQDTRDDSQSIIFKTQNAFRIEDADSNTNTNTALQTNAAIVDGAAPVLLTANSSTVGDGNGNTEKMTLKYTENVNESPYESSVTPSDYVVKVAPNGAQIPVSSVLLSPNSHPEQIVLMLDTSDTNQTTAPLNVSYALGTVKDWVNNTAATGTYSITDKARPILIGFTAIPNPAKIGDNLGFKLKFSEPMDTSSALTLTDFGFTFPFNTYNVNDATTGHTNGFKNSDESTWEGDYANNPIVLGTPVSGVYTFEDPSSGVDPNGNVMQVLSGLDMTFVIDSVPPATTGVSATSVKVGENTVITASATDDASGTGVASATYKITNLDTGTVVATGAMNATDGAFGDITEGLTVSVSTSGWTAGNYKVRVLATDTAGNTEAGSNVNVDTFAIAPAPADTTPPVITLLGQNPVTLTVGDTYVEYGATANDNIDGNISGNITTDSSAVDTSVAGTYVVTYNVSDAAGNAAVTATRTVIVVNPAITPIIPTITLHGTSIVHAYTATEAAARFASGLQFDITHAASVTVNGTSVAFGTTVTAASLADATALGFHVYNVVVTSSTGNTANMMVWYQVGADITLAVTGISAVPNDDGSTGYAVAGGDFAKGWRWVFHVTVPMNETHLNMKFDDFTGSGGVIPVASNLRFYSAQATTANASTMAITIGGSNAYSAPMTLSGDAHPNTTGRQVDITVEMRVPAGTAGGSYSTSYGIKTETP